MLAFPSLIKFIGFVLGLFWFVWVSGCLVNDKAIAGGLESKDYVSVLVWKL